MSDVEWGPNGFRPWRHQLDGLELLRKHNAYALLDDVGCGKTAPLAMRIDEILKEERKKNPHARALLIAEQTLIYQWPSGISQVAPGWDARWITGKMTTVQKRKFWAAPPDVICTNYEYIKSIKGELAAMRKHLVVVVCDEGHNLCGYRGPRSKQGKQAALIVALTKDIPHRYMASASLLDNPDSSRVWGALHWLDPKILPPTVSLFERGFYDNFSPSYRYKQLKLKPTMEVELSRRLRSVSRRVLLKDTGAEVPDRIIRDILVEMSPKLKKFYRQLRNDALAWHEDRIISRAEVLSRNMALLQVASGFIIDHPDPLEVMAAKMSGGDVPQHQILRIDTTHKDKALEAFCKDLGPTDKMIVWAHHTHEIDHLHEMLPDLRGCPVARVDGSVTGTDRERAIKLFTDGREFNTFLGQPGACGAGLNLQVAQYMVRWSRSHFITHHNQSLGRNLRAVRDQLFDKIVYASIMTDTTVDVRTELRNRGKREYAGRIMLDHLSYEERNL